MEEHYAAWNYIAGHFSGSRLLNNGDGKKVKLLTADYICTNINFSDYTYIR